MRKFQLKTVLKASLLDEMVASVYLLKLITWKQLSSINKFPCAHDLNEESSAKYWMSITLFLQGLNLLLTACFSMALPWFLSSHCIYFYCSIFHEKIIGLIWQDQRSRDRDGPKKKTGCSLNVKAEIWIYLARYRRAGRAEQEW